MPVPEAPELGYWEASGSLRMTAPEGAGRGCWADPAVATAAATAAAMAPETDAGACAHQLRPKYRQPVSSHTHEREGRRRQPVRSEVVTERHVVEEFQRLILVDGTDSARH